MADIRRVTDAFAVAPQINEQDVEQIAAAGFKTIIANRPDGEGGPLQPTVSAIRAKAESLGLTFVALPFSGAPTPEIVHQMQEILNGAPQPVLAYCRTGTRCITAWALTHAGQGAADEIVDAAADAGYDLSKIHHLL
ncbi:MAG TPA: TIGR01244 family sulfur transferase [Hyphomonas sp.]|nr:TIGR01244 family phosphatase [Hyphomonas sp.]MCB9962655.1 TIGR01244 family phosphatase [Hyphomonas sp.]MCB9970066.1 TIGR01244 family phosphatase [Hyphomonas sp.]HPE48582.1 TIGR01244 family sulfur transferase [Hyphomonas sp.]